MHTKQPPPHTHTKRTYPQGENERQGFHGCQVAVWHFASLYMASSRNYSINHLLVPDWVADSREPPVTELWAPPSATDAEALRRGRGVMGGGHLGYAGDGWAVGWSPRKTKFAALYAGSCFKDRSTRRLARLLFVAALLGNSAAAVAMSCFCLVSPHPRHHLLIIIHMLFLALPFRFSPPLSTSLSTL
jgi:hypothetical protein